MVLQYRAVDDKTRKATGLIEGEAIAFKRDGSYVITPKPPEEGGRA